MSDLKLHPGVTGDPDTGDGWLPELTLQHDGQRSELHVIVGETAEGMAEGVPHELWEQVQGRTSVALRLLAWIEKTVDRNPDGLGLSVGKGKHGYSVMGLFGREADDSPMAGGAIHGLDDTLLGALDGALRESRS